VNPFLSDLRNNGNWQSRIDLDSFLDYYLVREFTKDKDADFLFSNKYYTADVDDPATKIFMGPVWDFDRSAGAEAGITRTSVASPKGWWAREHSKNAIDARTHTPYHKIHWYNRLLNKPAFSNALCARWQQTRPIFYNAGRGTIAAATAALGGKRVANNDRTLWGGAGVERSPSRGAWKAEVRYLKRWYKQRYKWVNANIC
jgi:hypothetical protein